jgi:nicotinamide riboside transporter PnuC
MRPIDMTHHEQEKKLISFTLRLIGEVLATISLPVVMLTWLGRRLDARLGTKPALLAAGILTAFVISSVSMCWKAVKYRERYELLTEKPDDGAEARPPPPDTGMS